MPTEVQELIARLTALIDTATGMLEGNLGEVLAWQAALEEALVRYHLAAYMVGAGTEEVGEAARAAVGKDVRAQLDFLNGFRLVIQDGREWQRGWNARARLYATSIKVPYWRGKTQLLPLPAMPADGTQCLGNCGCAWDVVVVDDANGDYDAYWRRGKDDSCQTCLQRAADWAPYRIRGGMAQVDTTPQGVVAEGDEAA